jgi:hypothetical protein
VSVRPILEFGAEKENNSEVREGVEENKARVRSVPVRPTQKEVEEHEIDHAVFRDCCPHCVKGKAVSHPHYRGQEKDSEIPVIALDYMFLQDNSGKEDKKEDEERGMPIVVIKDSRSKMTFARAIPEKGQNAYAIRRVSDDVASLGYKRVVLKSDNEESMKALRRGSGMRAMKKS